MAGGGVDEESWQMAGGGVDEESLKSLVTGLSALQVNFEEIFFNSIINDFIYNNIWNKADIF